MTEPMTDDRRREMENLFKEGGHGLCYNNVRAAGRECLEIIDRLREENELAHKELLRKHTLLSPFYELFLKQ